MGRSLYRFYLYFVSSILMAFSAAGVATIVGTELENTPLSSQYPGGPYGGGGIVGASTQQIAFGSTLLIVAGGLLAVHYWLIRRDVRADPAGGASSNRAFFLNLVQLISALTALIAGTNTLSWINQQYRGDLTSSTAAALTAALVFALVELERRHTRAGPGAAIVFQRLQQSLTPLIILTTIGLSNWTTALNGTANAIAAQLNLYDPCYYEHVYGSQYGPPCPGAILGGTLLDQWLAAALVGGGWLVYLLLSRGDGRSIIRQVMRFLGLAFAMGVALNGVFQLADLVFIKAFHEAELPYGYSPPVAFAGPLIFGVVAVVVYVLILRADAATSPLGRDNTISALLAVTAVVAAGPFWAGCARVLDDIVEKLAHDTFLPDGREWAAAFALVISGIVYIPLALLLARRSARQATPGPRRGFALGMLAAGTIAGAAGAATVLYTVLTNVLGAPLTHWQQIARGGAVALVISAILVGIYATIVMREHYIKPLPTARQEPPATEPASTVAPEPATIEAVLDALLAGRVNREQAAARIRALTGARTE